MHKAITLKKEVPQWFPDSYADAHQRQMDCQYVLIVREDLDLLSFFGSNRLCTAVILSSPKKQQRSGDSDA